ncbi:unnamed protein product [Bursaphelenchus okinawaensis]|uniref:Uncharacterized protein n=1 Tax=Bursaphelenchus okinawaensis TaxID=465554 RepID=A0A811K6D7_9BILA|nr:unnamed protein product [Bursaphelenchus okinawaensis]CAG9092477.1 unnamed protein product [Bursaphelenchus okinawaensis]
MWKKKRKPDITHHPSVFPKFEHMDGVKKPRKCTSTARYDFTISAEEMKRRTVQDIVASTIESSKQLSVKPNKVEEIRKWLCYEQPRLRVLLLTGPSGCGKFTTLNVLCKENNIDIVEYVENQHLSKFVKEDGVELVEANQVTAFEDYLIHGSRRCLGQPRRKKIVLVREVPNVFVLKPDKLTKLLAELPQSCKTSVVFCLTQVDGNWNLNPRRFSSAIPSIIPMTQVVLNPIDKFKITNILKQLSGTFGYNADQKLLDAVKDKARGDINSALNFIELSRNQGKADMCEILHSSDLKSDIFHFLGKVMYAKRETVEDNIKRQEIEETVKEKYRRIVPPTHTLQELLDLNPLQSHTLVNYVAHYKMMLVKDVHACANMYRDLCIADRLGTYYDTVNEGFMEQYAQKVVPVGLMSFSKPPVPSKERLKERILEVNRVYPTKSSTDLLTSYFPLLSLMPSKGTLQETSLMKNLK